MAVSPRVQVSPRSRSVAHPQLVLASEGWPVVFWEGTAADRGTWSSTRQPDGRFAAPVRVSGAVDASYPVAAVSGTAAAQVGPKYSQWVEVTYARPILRGRADIFGSGANVSTRLKTDVPLVIGGTTVPAGEYSVFIELKGEQDWTFVLSSYGALVSPKEPKPDHLWGAYGYKADKDVARAPITVSASPVQVDQLTWGFTDVTEQGGTLRICWAKTAASVAFTTGM